ncbi:MAG: hypothetical protein KC613_17815 [Myxococcales bacterium]|nr:hypothetical protein [Myxococcales bacterium]MCB9522580.1 hypothetical protein [Myxococcales bacterium]
MRRATLLCLLAFTACDDPSTTPADARIVDGGPQDCLCGSDRGVLDPDQAPLDEGAADMATDRGIDMAPDATPLPELPTRPRAQAPADPLAGAPVESCAIIDDTRCVDGQPQTCAVYDATAGAFVEPDPLLRRALLFDRWYARYHSPDGQTAERVFNAGFPAGTPEAEWGDPARFLGYDGWGDSAIWTGVALHGTALRYLSTGTQADYARMVAKARALLVKFDVTGVPGYLARAHYGYVEPGAPPTDAHLVLSDARLLEDHRSHDFDPATVPDAPPVYTQGYPGPDGPVAVRPRWHGNPSIDQYSGPMVAFPLVADLLRPEDAEIRDRMVRHLTCYLKRLERVEIVHAQQNPEIIDVLQQLLGGGRLTLDEGDPDFSQLDTVVGYYLPQLNPRNAADYPRDCPAEIQLEPTRVLDLASPRYLGELVQLATDLQSRDNVRATGIDHFYVPSVRAGDANHLMHLAAIGYHFTGEEQYRRFFHEQLVQSLNTFGVIQTAGALQVPDWCRSFYGGHITYPAFWSLWGLLDDPALREPIARALHDEFWARDVGPLADLKFDLMFATVADAWPAAQAEARARALAAFDVLGGNGGTLDDPRRAYNVAPETVIDALGGPEQALRCPSADDRAACIAPVTFMGLEFPGEDIGGACRGDALDCPFEDGTCARALATAPVPIELRAFTDFLWQRNPFQIGYSTGAPGHKQSPGLDIIEAYWLARYTGVIQSGAGQVLAWQPGDGACGAP